MTGKVDYDLFLSSWSNSRIVDLSDSSIALFFTAITEIVSREKWQTGGDDLDDVQWDSLDRLIGLAQAELMTSLVGMIFPSAMATHSAFKFLHCDGSQYLRVDYPLLYGGLDSVFIVDADNFVTPDLRGNTIIGTDGTHAIGDTGGEVLHTLTIDEMPSHDHDFTQYTFGIDIESVGVPDPTGVGNPRLPETTGLRGGGQSHNNMQPFIAIPYVIIAG